MDSPKLIGVKLARQSDNSYRIFAEVYPVDKNITFRRGSSVVLASH